MAKCAQSSDCSEIIDGKIVLKVCYEEMYGTDKTFFCDCSGNQGFIGEKCNEHSVQTIYAGSLAIFSSIITFIGILAAILIVFKHKKIIASNSGDVNIRTKRLLTVLGVLIFFEFTFDFAKALTDVYFFGNPEEAVIVQIKTIFIGNNSDNSYDIISTPAGIFPLLYVPLSFLFNSVTTLMVLTSWLRVVKQVSEIFDKEYAKHVRRLIIGSLFFYIVVSIAIIISSIMLYVAISGILLALLNLFMLFLVVYTRHLFLKIVKLYCAKQKQSKAIQTIKAYSKWFIIVYLIYFVLVVTHIAYGAGAALRIPPGKFNYPSIFFDAAKLGKFCLQFPTLFYIQRVFTNLNKSESKETSLTNPND